MFRRTIGRELMTIDNPFLWIAVGHLAQRPFSVIIKTI